MPALTVGILHPDLGIGGAERLVVDAAVGLQKLGHQVEIYTSHHDPNHCFEETKNGSLSVHHIPSPFPRALFGRFHIVFAILSQLHLVIRLLLGARSNSLPICDVYMVDQLSACIPLLRWGLRRRVVFYCHFPDKLLAGGQVAPSDGVRREPIIKKLYRIPVDWLEEKTTQQADAILANSNFTVGVFKNAFPSIRMIPQVVYPGINVDSYEHADYDVSDIRGIKELLNHPTLLSLNRFEGKKNLGLAIKAYARFKASLSDSDKASLKGELRLILGGGFDPRLQDNVKTLSALQDLCHSLKLTDHVYPPSVLDSLETPLPPLPSPLPDVTFLPNFTTPQRSALLHSRNTLALLYTPENEHFGIGPVEAMITHVPVLACGSGGPTESIVGFPKTEYDSDSLSEKDSTVVSLKETEQPTGYLLPSTPEAFAKALRHLLFILPPFASPTDSHSALTRASLLEAAHARAVLLFSMDTMARSLSSVLESTNAIPGRISFIKNIAQQNTVKYWPSVVVALCAVGLISVYLGWFI